MSKKKPASKKPAKKRSPAKVLDEKTSAIVIAEYLAIEEVKESEVTAVIDDPHPLSHREIALAFRVSEVLEIPCCFQIAPRYGLAFKRAQALMGAFKAALEARAA